jgi:DNA-binding NarL/FixJ family response regulator
MHSTRFKQLVGQSTRVEASLEPSELQHRQDHLRPPIHLRIFSDVRLHRDGLASLLSGWPSIEVLGAYRLVDALHVLRTEVTDVALLDAPRLADTRLVDALRRSCSTVRLVAIGVRETASNILSCAAAGVHGYVHVDAAISDTVSSIERLVRNGIALSQHLTAALSASIGNAPRKSAQPMPDALTLRELQVAELMNRGLANKEIARQLAVEPCTAKNHVRNIMRKLQVHRRGEAVAKLRALIGERFEVPIKQ